MAQYVRGLALVVVLLPGAAGGQSGGTLDRLVADFDASLTRSLPAQLKTLDFALATLVDPSLGGATGLQEVVARLLLNRLNRRGFRSCTVLERGKGLAAAARSKGVELLLAVKLVSTAGHLHLRGELRDTSSSLWRDLLSPHRGSLSHLHARVRLDAEVRAYLGRRPSGRLSFTMRQHGLQGNKVLAAIGGDVDGDGRSDLLLLRPRALELYELSGGRLKLRLRHALAIPAATLRSRRALGVLVLERVAGRKTPAILLRSSEQAAGAELRWTGGRLVTQGQLTGYPLVAPPLAGARVHASAASGADYFPPQPISLVSAAAASKPALLPQLPAFYGLRAERIATPKGPRDYVAMLDVAGRLQLFAGRLDQPLLSMPAVGVAFDLADLDDDGALDLVLSSGEEAGRDDHLTVVRAQKGAARLIWQSARLGGQVRALAHGDFDGDGKLELAAAVCGKRCHIALFD